MCMITTKNGTIRGAQQGRWQCYRGIPYGQPPIGRLRFQPPHPVEPWDGVFDATRNGTRPWQKIAPWVVDADSHTYGEDCLNLNVWVPEGAHEGCPVLVYFFGGGHFEGSNCEKGIEAEGIFGDQPYILVTPNYRVGALGYLYLGHLLGEAYATSGSLGTLDQILSLKWVRDHIESFGGDPDNITIMGQSAGAKSVACLLATPLARGLFRRAILMSGALQCVKDIHTEKILTQNYMAAAGITDPSAILTMTPEEIRAAQEKANDVYFKAESYGPTADGVVFPVDFDAHLAALDLRGIDILMGGTAQELYLSPEDAQTPLTDEQMAPRMNWKFGLNAEHVLKRYLERKKTVGFEAAYGEIVTEYTYVQGTLKTASLFAKAGASVHLYRWDYHDEGNLARHTSDLETLFGILRPVHSDVAKHLRGIWQSFIRNGNPLTSEIAYWPASSKDMFHQLAIDRQDQLLSFGPERMDADFPLQVLKL